MRLIPGAGVLKPTARLWDDLCELAGGHLHHRAWGRAAKLHYFGPRRGNPWVTRAGSSTGLADARLLVSLGEFSEWTKRPCLTATVGSAEFLALTSTRVVAHTVAKLEGRQADGRHEFYFEFVELPIVTVAGGNAIQYVAIPQGRSVPGGGIAQFLQIAGGDRGGLTGHPRFARRGWAVGDIDVVDGGVGAAQFLPQFRSGAGARVVISIGNDQDRLSPVVRQIELIERQVDSIAQGRAPAGLDTLEAILNGVGVGGEGHS